MFGRNCAFQSDQYTPFRMGYLSDAVRSPSQRNQTNVFLFRVSHLCACNSKLCWFDSFDAFSCAAATAAVTVAVVDPHSYFIYIINFLCDYGRHTQNEMQLMRFYLCINCLLIAIRYRINGCISAHFMSASLFLSLERIVSDIVVVLMAWYYLFYTQVSIGVVDLFFVKHKINGQRAFLRRSSQKRIQFLIFFE